ncbi:Cupin domain protein [Luteibacter sp. UNCMF331Sha3.1]|uniref:cupin domain-containing protein n=1 Tax=Luteibacter sp. UNCMF331Sha3.1 TaxID=1502760 RepID=UPI0008B7CC38|nr:cupin domain-containing protein [Luteibacter sp. UNCMF331Sha3.1]SEM51675.1 Cupin domain protein [Luteibacter sp. UNCMF331Sha3.1]
MHARTILASLALLATTTMVQAAAPSETVKPNFSEAIPNLPGKSLTAVEVLFPPGAASHPHKHAHSAFIYAYVVSGRIVSQVEGQPARTYTAGESFHEDPGAHHLAARNPSSTEPAKLLAVFVVDSDEKALTTPDP